MATRRDVLQRKAHLRRTLLQSCRDGSLVPGEMLPSLRHLALEHGLSAPTASQVIRELVAEGVLYTRSTAGTFMGRPPEMKGSLYLLVTPTYNTMDAHVVSLRDGFEERIAQLGGSSLCLDHTTAHQWKNAGRLPATAGMFDFTVAPEDRMETGEQGFQVRFGKVLPNESNIDKVFFDNVDGGRQATFHLLRLGHRQIAFLGLHAKTIEDNVFLWSLEREKGWREALKQAGSTPRGLLFHPQFPLAEVHEHSEQRNAARDAAYKLVRRTDITAVVAANVYATEGLLQALREAQIPQERWPAVVSFDQFPYHTFDEAPYNDRHVISALRLPWENLGREAASILWERSRGDMSGPAQQRLVPMRLIPRLSCRREWPLIPISPLPSQSTLVSAA